MTSTSIEWTDHSVNPIRMRSPNGKSGHYCEKVSTGCKNCYSSRFQPRVGLPQFKEQRGNTEGLFFDASKLEEVLRRKKPTKFFWCDMTDMFGEWVPFEWIAACFGVMAATPHHTHQVLTKRPGRALEFFEWASERGDEFDLCRFGPSALLTCAWEFSETSDDEQLPSKDRFGETWPLPNVHLGVSTEDQKTADERIPLLLQCPAAVHWVSAEPLLGPVDLSRYLDLGAVCECTGKHGPKCEGKGSAGWIRCNLGLRRIRWVVVGGESGPGARPFNIDWARSILQQAAAAPGWGTEKRPCPVFVKQLGRLWCDGKLRRGRRGSCAVSPLDPWEWVDGGHKKGADMSEWPADLRVREFPEVSK